MENNENLNNNKKQTNILKKEIGFTVLGTVLLIAGIIIPIPLAIFTIDQWKLYRVIDMDNITGLLLLSIIPLAGICTLIYEIVRKKNTVKTSDTQKS